MQAHPRGRNAQLSAAGQAVDPYVDERYDICALVGNSSSAAATATLSTYYVNKHEGAFVIPP